VHNNGEHEPLFSDDSPTTLRHEIVKYWSGRKETGFLWSANPDTHKNRYLTFLQTKCCSIQRRRQITSLVRFVVKAKCVDSTAVQELCKMSRKCHASILTTSEDTAN